MDIIRNYKALPLGKFQQIVELKRNADIEDIDRHIKILAILTDKGEDELLRLPLPEFKLLGAAASFLDKDIEAIPHKPKKVYRVGDFDLVPTMDVTKMTAAQFIDYNTMTAGLTEKDLDAHIVEILSCFLVPKGMEYCDGYDVAEVQAALRDNLPVFDAITMLAFFLRSSVQYVKDSLRYSVRMAKGIKDKKKRKEMLEKISEAAALLRNGDGLQM